MFLTTRRLAHEKLWRLWMWDAAGLLPMQALPLARVRPLARHLCGSCAAAARPIKVPNRHCVSQPRPLQVLYLQCILISMQTAP